MRPRIEVAIEKDPARPALYCLVIRGPDGFLHQIAENLTRTQAQVALMPARKAFGAGMAWLREDASSYILSTNPEICCSIKERP